MQKLDTLFEMFSGFNIASTKGNDLSPKAATLVKPSDLPCTGLLEEDLIDTIEKVELTTSVPSKRWLRANDILIVSRGTSFRAVLIKAKLKPEQCLATQSLLVLRPNHSHPEWCVNFLNSDWFNYSYIQKFHTPKITLNIKELQNYEVTFPDEAQRIKLANDFYKTKEIVKAAQELILRAKQLNEAKLINLLKTPHE